jgi:hypothetical protein
LLLLEVQNDLVHPAFGHRGLNDLVGLQLQGPALISGLQDDLRWSRRDNDGRRLGIDKHKTPFFDGRTFILLQLTFFKILSLKSKYNQSLFQKQKLDQYSSKNESQLVVASEAKQSHCGNAERGAGKRSGRNAERGTTNNEGRKREVKPEPS